MDDVREIRGDDGFDVIGRIWNNNNAWALSGGKISCDVSRKVDAQELPIIQLFQHDGRAFGGPGTTSTAPPQLNGLEQP
jgi:hypothetical protein